MGSRDEWTYISDPFTAIGSVLAWTSDMVSYPKPRVMASRRAARQWSEDVAVSTPDCVARHEDVQHAAVRHEIQPALESSEFKPICQPQMQETSDSFAAVISERPPLPPFPRMTTPAPKIIEFPRMHVHQYELAEPVAEGITVSVTFSVRTWGVASATSTVPTPLVNLKLTGSVA